MRVLLRLPEVQRRTGYAKRTIYTHMQAGTFPRPVKIAARSVGWIEEEIERYVEDKITARDQPRERTP